MPFRVVQYHNSRKLQLTPRRYKSPRLKYPLKRINFNRKVDGLRKHPFVAQRPSAVKSYHPIKRHFTMRRHFSRYLGRLILASLLFSSMAFYSSALAGQPWKFIVTGDCRGSDDGVNAKVLAPLAERIARSGADFLLFSGDLMSGSSSDKTTQEFLEHWLAVMQPVYKAGIKVYPIAGNHEWSDGNLPEVWRRVFPDLPGNGPKGEEKMTYSFAHKNAFIVGIDEYSNHRHRVDQQWLDAQLAARDAAAQPHLFVFGHEPAYAAKHRDTLDNYEEARDAFVQSLLNAGGRIYFCGHDHFYDRTALPASRSAASRPFSTS